jgi:uncharacterized protein (TIGR02594 family)
MLRFFAALALVVLSSLAASAEGGPDSIRVCDASGCRYVNEAARASKFGTFTPKAKSKASDRVVAGRAFKQTPNVVSYHSDGTAWVNEARKYIGMTGAQLAVKHRGVWCGEFMGRVARAVGMPAPKHDALAANWGEVGQRISAPRPGAVALVGGCWKRNGVKRCGVSHVGIVTGVQADGDPIIISGNHANRVVETAYARGRITAYVWPGG